MVWVRLEPLVLGKCPATEFISFNTTENVSQGVNAYPFI